MKRGILAAALIGSALMLTGCGGFNPEVTGVSIGKNGKITEVIRESFDASYYDEKELESLIDSEIETYNAANGEDSVRKRSLKIKDGIAKVRLTYADSEDYAAFNSVGFYVGSIGGAIQAGYAFEGSFYPVSKGKADETQTVWGSSLMTGTKYSSVVVNEALLIDVPGEIKYVSDNVKVTGKSEAVTESTETAYVLYE